MAISTTPVQQKVASTATGNSLAITLDSTPTAGNLLVITVHITLSYTVTSITGGGCTWVKAVSNASTRACEIWYGENNDGSSASITVNKNGYNTDWGYNISEWSGVATSSSLDTTANDTDTVTNTSSIPSVTPVASSNCLLIAASTSGSTRTAGATDSYTNLTDVNNTYCNAGYRVVSSASGGYTTTWTVNNNYQTHQNCHAVFKAAAGGGGGGTPTRVVPQIITW